MPASPITAADLCGEHRRGRSRLLTATSTTAGPGVSVLIITLLTVIYRVAITFFDTDTHRELNKWSKKSSYWITKM